MFVAAEVVAEVRRGVLLALCKLIYFIEKKIEAEDANGDCEGFTDHGGCNL